jgi:NADPH:quinone reductase
VDVLIRYGLAVDYFPVRPPYVPGNGVAGTVLSVGDGVDPAWVGRAVAAHTGEMGGGGGYAEQVVAAVGDLIPVPASIGLPRAAALLHDGATALGLIEAIGVKPGEWVLVTAAAGGMGVVLVQLARTAGGRVIGAARGGRKLDAVRDAGAEAAVDYSEPGWTDQVRMLTAGHGADVVFDGAGGQLGRAAFDVTADGGRFSAHGTSDGGFAHADAAQASRRGVTVRPLTPHAPGEFLRLATAALAEAAAGRIWPVIGQTFPLTRAADAHAAIEARTTIAKTLLVP